MKYLVFIFCLMLVVSFQNCAKHNFTGGGSSSMSQVASEELRPDSVLVINDNLPQGNYQVTTHDSNLIEVSNSYSDSSSSSSAATTSSNNFRSSSQSQAEVHPALTFSNFRPDVQPLSYICEIYTNDSKSSHLALGNEILSDQKKTPRSICMSMSACQSIVGKVMKVKSAEYRGFCKNKSANTVSLTDEQVKELVLRK